MCSESLNNSATELSTVGFEQLGGIVESEFTIEEGLVEYDVPTFYVRLDHGSKKAFLRLVKRLDAFGFVPVLRDKEGKVVLQIVPKPPVKSSRRIINWVLFLATIGTTLVTGYILSLGLMDPLGGAVMFAVALLGILGSHEMGHTLAAKMHGIESTLPYFIPGPPWPFGIGTFGAVIQQKSLAPNRDSLFDLGASGPIVGFVVTVLVTIIGLQMSSVGLPPPEAFYIPVPVLFEFIAEALLSPGPGMAVMLHPVAFAGWVGMIVTVLNLIPVGMYDGGHIARTFLGDRMRTIISYLAIITFLGLGFLIWEAFIIWAVIAIFFSFIRHPGPLDDASKVTAWRKLTALGIAAIFFLSFPFLI